MNKINKMAHMIQNDELLLICDKWATKDEISIAEKIDSLVSYLTADIMRKKNNYSTHQVTLIKLLTLRRNLPQNFEISIVESCKFLIDHIITLRSMASKESYNNEPFEKIMSLSLEVLILANEDCFCKNIVDSCMNKLTKADGMCEEQSLKFSLNDLYCILCALSNVKHRNTLRETIPSTLQVFQSKIFQSFISDFVLCCKNTYFECYTLYSIIPKLVEVADVNTVVNSLWNKIDSTNAPILLPLKLNILCGLIELLPLDQVPKINAELLIIETNRFWVIIQEAMISDNALHRKRGIYLLKRTLDYVETFNLQLDLEIVSWNHFQSSSLKCCWDRMFIVLDVLEEKQSHLVTPVIQTILRGNGDDIKLIHFSWLLIIFMRIFAHDSLQVIKQGILKFLKIDVDSYVGCASYKTVIEMLFNKLNNMMLFTCGSCDTGKTSWTEMDSGLNDWFNSIPLKLMKRDCKEFYNTIFDAVMKVQWSTLPLFHVFHSLSLVTLEEVIDESILQRFMDFLKDVIRTQNVLFRSAVQCSILNFITSSSCSGISSFQAANTLSAFRQNECLFRGLETWEKSKNWLKSCSGLASDVLVDMHLSKNNVGVESVARSLVLFVDSGLIVLNSTFDASLKNYFSVLENSGNRLYASTEKSDKCLEMILKLLEESMIIHPEFELKNDPLIKSLDPYIKEVVPYIVKRILYSNDDLTNYNSAQLYSKILKTLIDCELISFKETSNMTENTCKITFSPKYHPVKRYLSLNIIQCYVEVFKVTSKNKVPRGSKNVNELCLSLVRDFSDIMNITKDPKDEDLSRQHQSNWGQLLSGYLESFWTIIKTGLCAEFITATDLLDIVSGDTIVERAINSIESGGKNSIAPTLTVLKYILPFVENLDTVLRFLQFSWTSCFELRKVAMFWPSIEAWIEMTFCREVIIRKGLHNALLNFAKEILLEGDNVCGLSNALLKHMKNEFKDVISIKPLLDVLVSALLFGPVLRRDQRIENETTALIMSLGPTYATNVLIPKGGSRSTSSGEVRVTALAVLLRGGEGVWCEAVCRLIEHDGRLTAQRKRCHSDSLSHRLRHRTLQALLVLESALAGCQSVRAKGCVAGLAKWAGESLQAAGHQPSVRYQLEWLLVRAILHSPQLLPNFWTVFKQASDERTGSICSFISVAYHLAATVKDAEFIDRCVKEILPWCMAQHFNVRLYAQVVLQKLWPLNGEIASKYDVLRQSLSQSLNQGNAVRNSEKLSNEFYFTTFHPLNHFSLETVFYELPRLSNISKDEWVLFDTIQDCWSNQDLLVSLGNSDDDLCKFTTPAWIVKATAESENNSVIEAIAMQKKFVPWKSMFPELELAEKEKPNSGSQLTVVASLIDKLPNLGGLARTCEIFNAQCLVVPSLECTQDKLFETLSMSAEKHINIVEVKPHDLPHYLREKKASGYTIVGAEQTAASVSLRTFKFPKKCLLVLGNEKEGIPVNLLPHMDTCVEVPQLGVVRSLNVHVTGALFVWEYVKQFLYSP